MVVRGYINNITVHYTYNNGVDVENARQILNLISVEEEEKQEINEFEKCASGFEFIPEDLQELSVSFEFRKKKDN